MSRFVFVTGGVLSSVGKGVAIASLASLMEARGAKVSIMKLDPYLNVDPGTMNPFQHGEVFVTEDGAETDLDLGHYERFTKASMSAANTCTTGQIYSKVIEKERKGEYQGATVQVIPHITDEIKSRIKQVSHNVDLTFVEIGGTIGDIESQPFLEAIRQVILEMGSSQALCIHVTYVPYLESSGETKTKPTQHSIRDLRATGLSPDVILCRSERQVGEAVCQKIALSASIPQSHVIPLENVDSVYEVPSLFSKRKLDEILLNHFGMALKKADLSDWEEFHQKRTHLQKHKKVFMVGKYALKDAYFSLCEALLHAGIHSDTQVEIVWVESETLEHLSEEKIRDVFQGADGVLSPGGFGVRGVLGKMLAARFARKNQVPYLGICLGMQVALIDYAQDVLGLSSASSTEFDPSTKTPLFGLIEEWMDESGQKVIQDQGHLGGTMRLGSQPFSLKEGSLWREIYQQKEAFERHRHRYEFNATYAPLFEKTDLVFSGHALGGLLECIELPKKVHPFFLGCQSHPEFHSRPRMAHPLFLAYVNAL